MSGNRSGSAGHRIVPRPTASGMALLGSLVMVAAATGEARIPELRVTRIADDAIVLDGRLSEAAWERAERVEEWFEVSPGDNVPPAVQTIGYLAFDARYLYIAVDCRDPDPSRIRSALGDRDGYGLSDAVGVALDTRNDGKIASEFWVNAGGSQFDAINDDGTGTEDPAPDFFWDSAVRLSESGWTLEIRIPFSTLRYADRDPEAWRILIQRNYPREFFYQYAATTIPRGSSCYVCRANPLRGLAGLPEGSGLVVAPFGTGRGVQEAEGKAGMKLGAESSTGKFGADLKWTPHPSLAVDATVHPDFSQIEADVAQIGANERFALFYDEKRPFFLEGRELLTTPVQAVHTRTVTAPQWGGRATGRWGSVSYAVLASRDEGGGSVIVPGATSSSLVQQDFPSEVWIGRLRRDFAGGFVGLLGTGREIVGGGQNRVFGPDFQWRPNARDTVTGQLLLSRSITPRRPDLESEWDGRGLAGHAGDLRWLHAASRFDWLAEYRDVSQEFRADNGFVPQVGYRRSYGEAGWTLYPQGWIRRVRWFALAERSTDRQGDLLGRQISAGASVRGRWSSAATLRIASEQVSSGEAVLPRRQLLFDATVRPLRTISEVQLAGSVGEAIDFDHHRTGTGADVTLSATLRPSRHLELKLDLGRRLVDVDASERRKARLFMAQVGRLKATYHFSPRSFARLVAQQTETRREPALYRETVPPRSADATGSVLFAYRLNWQTAVYLGYGDDRELSERDRLERTKRELFLKLSYAFQR